MALQSEVSPTIVGDPNKDTQIDGDTKSDENHSSQSTDDDADLEDGEILESEGEEEKDFSNVSLKEALDKSCLQNIEQLVNQAKNSKVVASPDRSKIASPRKSKRMPDSYMDHDRAEPVSDQEKGWFPPSPKYKSKFSDKPIDYRMELAAYRGTPPSSPERSRRNREDKLKKKRSSKKSKKTKKTIRRKDIKGQRVASFKRDAAKGKICKFFKEGKCAKGSDCYFSHAMPSFKKKDLCKFYLNGHCNKGKDCTYMHSEFPCKFYHTGSECYAKNDCRFSHAPLSEEMKKILADYLRSCHGDDLRHNRNDDRDRNEHDRGREWDRDHDRKRPISHSPEPPPPKRTCLLGSPPRHIREAEETKRWQEEMKMLQMQNHPSFEIHLAPDQDEMAEAEFQKPNFYQETLLNTPSPKKRPPIMDAPFHQSSMDDYGGGSPSKVYVYDEDEFIEIDVPAVKQEPPEEYHHWENVHNMPHPGENHAKPFIENTPHPQELDFTNDVKFDETTQFSEMESSDCPPAASPDSAPEDTSINEPPEDKQQQHPDDSTSTVAPPPPIIVPTHLPRKQQELFMRVLQHQRLNQANVGGSPDGNDDAEIKKEPDNEPEEKFQMGIKESEWYTSEEEDDDEDNDGQLLKKIQQAPPKAPEVKPAAKVDLLAIFNTIQQKTKEKNKGLSEIQQKHSSFWQNILGGVTASKAAPPPVSNPAPLEPPKRRTLLPDPIIKTEPTTPAEPPAIKDPRLKNRDPRKLTREPKPEISIPKPNIASIQELDSPPIKPTATSEQTKESIPYRLRGISAKPLNYTPYLHASQSNPSLLKDPRLRKHLQNNEPVNGNEKDHDIVKLPAPPPKNAPPIPELLLKYEKPVAAINIFESSSSSKPLEKSDAKPSINVSVTYDPSDMKGRVPIPVPVIPSLDSKIGITVPVAYDPVESKSRAPVPVAYDPVGSKSPARIPTSVTYEPLDSKSRVPVPVTASYDPVDLKSRAPVPVAASYDPVDLKSRAPIPVTASYDPVDSKSRAPVPVTALYDQVDSKISAPVPRDPVEMKSSSPVLVSDSYGAKELKSCAPVSKRRDSGGSKKRAAKSSLFDPRAKRRDSHTSNSGSDTPPHLTIVDSVTTPPQQDFKSAPVLENELVEVDEKKHIPPVPEKKNIPPVPEKKHIPPVLEKSLTPPPIVEEDIIAAIKKELESDSDSNQDPPPQASKSSHKKSISPPIVEQFMTVIKKEVPQDSSGDSKPVVPPLIIKKVKPTPTPASHLPKAIADPRMAKLHNPRRPRLAASNISPRRTSERRKAALEAEAAIEAAAAASEPKSPKASKTTDEKPKAAKSIPKKRRLSDKTEEKKKTVHRNRKSSMDYASPLNSCDATDEGKSSSYNRYNQRPKRGVTVAAAQTGKVSPTTSAARSPSDSSSIPEFALSDSSNLECDNSNDVNLKDRFKTIDPTASPFC